MTSSALAAILVGIGLMLPPPVSSPLTIAISARSLQPGELIVVRIEDARPSTAHADSSGLTDVRVAVFGRTTRAFADRGGWTALAGIDLEQRPGRYSLTATAHRRSTEVEATQPLVVQPKQFATRTLKVSPEFVNPPASVAARIAADVGLLKDVYAHSADEPLWRRPFVRPVPQDANSRFGQRSRFNGELRSPHAGTDFMSPAGTPVQAPNAGRVVVARDLYFTGNTVVIDHGLGVFSTLAHLSRVDVQEGQHVNGGDVVGLVGATGRVTGPHLHWALRVGGARVDAMSILALLGQPPASGR
ncbi:MAG TPA: M23 family metallopeptidase [Vicinamibacterales bacterium]|jgi:murein DD-endopeptidase MepM/ murein hydrolase activator NlpD|nr:M23 family metallopeptidase [Vicinamibacterales bacterium]